MMQQQPNSQNPSLHAAMLQDALQTQAIWQGQAALQAAQPVFQAQLAVQGQPALQSQPIQSTPSPSPPMPQQTLQFDLSMFEGDYTVKNSVVRVSNGLAQFLDENGDCLTVREGQLSVVFINKKCSVMLTLATNPQLRFYWTGMGDDYIEWTHCSDMNNAIRWTRIPKQYSMMPQMVATPTHPAGALFRYAYPNEFVNGVPMVWNSWHNIPNVMPPFVPTQLMQV